MALTHDPRHAHDATVISSGGSYSAWCSVEGRVTLAPHDHTGRGAWNRAQEDVDVHYREVSWGLNR